MSDTLPTPATPSQPLIAPDWTERRRIIFAALRFCGVMFALIVCCFSGIAVTELFVKASIDPNVVALLSSALYTIAFVATSIIGSYVFGMNLDWANTRQHIVDLLNTNAGIETTPLRTARIRPTPKKD